MVRPAHQPRSRWRAALGVNADPAGQGPVVGVGALDDLVAPGGFGDDLDQVVASLLAEHHLTAEVGRAVLAENYAAYVAEYGEPA